MELSTNQRRRRAFAVFLSVLTVGLYLFPKIWYSNGSGTVLWFAERTEIEGWSERHLAISEVAEAQLGADKIVNSELTRPDGKLVRVFSAKYFSKDVDATVFAHTPDRCWPQSGWSLDRTTPETQVVRVGQTDMVFERRCFRHGAQAELVYFGALVAGQPLPFRLNQYYGSALHTSRAGKDVAVDAYVRAGDKEFWGWMWNCFRSRRPMKGPSHFIRISTPVSDSTLSEGDKVLRESLPALLTRIDFAEDLQQWKQAAKAVTTRTPER